MTNINFDYDEVELMLADTEFAYSEFDFSRVGKITKAKGDAKYYAEAKQAVKSHELAKKLGLHSKEFVKIFPLVWASWKFGEQNCPYALAVETRNEIAPGSFRTELFVLGFYEDTRWLLPQKSPIYPLCEWLVFHAQNTLMDKHNQIIFEVGAENHLMFHSFQDGLRELSTSLKQNRVWDMEGFFDPDTDSPYQIQSYEFELYIRREWPDNSVWEDFPLPTPNKKM